MTRNEYTESRCEDCDEALIQLDGDYFCPACDSMSGFTLTPDEDEFVL